ncbi:MFS transporter [Pseudoduganella sp.]|uniref:MFS transporter n=1 Tax=Pseudoduganella sp. TaxID=1880898 RepID=UPI0035B17274
MSARWLRLDHAAYGLLGLPLAMAALPVYVHLPAFYALQLDVSLAQLGWVLFAARLFDTLQDPALGLLVDRLGQRTAPWLGAAAALFGLAFAGLWLPPANPAAAVPWLAAMLVLAYCAHSFLNIAYLAWGATLDGGAARSHGQAHALLGPAAWREGAGLAGIMLASAIPAAIMAGDTGSVPASMAWYSAGFALLLALALWALLRWAPAWQRASGGAGAGGQPWRQALQRLRSNGRFLRLLPPYFLNAVSMALPATLALFFIRDQLQAPAQAAGFLLAYFAAAVCGLPLWVRLAARIGTARAWRLGMLLAVATFAGAGLLGPGDQALYLLACIGAGAALGADLALPPVLFAQAVRPGESMGIHYSVYTLLGKLALACTGLALPLLAALGYRPGAGPSPALAAMYAGLPCLFKLGAMFILWRLDEKDHP